MRYGFPLAENGVRLLEVAAEQRGIQLIRCRRRQGCITREVGRELERLRFRPRSGWHWHPKVIMDACRRDDIDAAGRVPAAHLAGKIPAAAAQTSHRAAAKAGAMVQRTIFGSHNRAPPAAG